MADTTLAAVAIGLATTGVELMLSEAAPGIGIDSLPWDKLGGTAALIAALGLALKFMAGLHSKAQDDLKKSYDERIQSLESDKSKLEVRCKDLEDKLIQFAERGAR